MQRNVPTQSPVHVTSYTLTSALGVGNGATLQSLFDGRGGLSQYQLRSNGTTWLGLMPRIVDQPITGSLAAYDCRPNRLLGGAMAQDGFMEAVSRARNKYGSERVGCFLGTITAALIHVEDCYRDHHPERCDLGPNVRANYTFNLHSVTEYCQKMLSITGPSVTISTACSSSSKVFAAAQRYIDAGLCDAAVVAGVDCACDTFIYGFRSLGLLSSEPCRPWDRRRNGISIGEAAGFALLERHPAGANGIVLLGSGETSDAYHMTAPHPEGEGAELAMRRALLKAGLEPSEVDYINLHGSGTLANDVAEDLAVLRVFGDDTPCSSTKGWTGHTQGAAGITEAVLSMLSIEHSFIPGTLNLSEPDPKLGARVLQDTVYRPVKSVLTNSFGFGGNNSALIFGATP